MSLVDYDKPYRQFAQFGHETAALQFLRRYIKYAGFAQTAFVKHQTVFPACKPAMKEIPPYAMRQKIVDLILHQGNQRGHNNRKPVDNHRRHLESNRLPAPGSHKAEGVVTCQHRIDYLSLHGAERIIAPMPLQHLSNRRHESQPRILISFICNCMALAEP